MANLSSLIIINQALTRQIMLIVIVCIMIENGSFRHSGRVVKASDLSQKIDIT